MKGYWLILGTAITDQEAQNEYGRLWAPIAAKYKAKLIANSPALALLEARDTARILLVEFPDLVAAKACYADPDYQAAMKLALKASQRQLVVLEADFG